MNKRIPIIIGIVMTFFCMWMLVTPNKYISELIEQIENTGYDLQLRTRLFTTQKAPNSAIAIVDFDNKSLKVEGRWPWPRAKLADLVQQLKEQGAVVVAFDILFPEPEENMVTAIVEELSKKNMLTPVLLDALKKRENLFAEDQIFAKSLSEGQSILSYSFLPSAFKQNILPPPILILPPNEAKQLQLIKANGYVSNIPILQQAAKANGFINIYPDNDGIYRRAPMVMAYQNGIYPSLALAAVRSFLSENVSLVIKNYDKGKKIEGIKLGSTMTPTDSRGQVLIPFIGRSYTFPYYSATDVLHHHIPKNALLGKIVFIGVSAVGVGNLKSTAIQRIYPGVEIQATLANGLLDNFFYFRPVWTLGADLVLVLIVGLVTALLFPYLSPKILGVIVIISPPLLLLYNNVLWEKTGIIFPLLAPIIIIVFMALLNFIYGYLFEFRRREYIRTLFGQYVPEEHVDEMLKKDISQLGLLGEDRNMSVLFADIRNFTSISENMSASELVEMLNTFFSPLTETIFKYHGTIDKYIGDLVMAFWGAPLEDKKHAEHAIMCALEMRARIKQIQPIMTKEHWPEIKVGIAINSGLMSVGDMGTRFRRNYTVLGDAVNLASRIESLTKFYGIDIIVTEYTKKHQSKFIFRKLDRVRVKGKEKGIVIYEVIDHKLNISKELSQELSIYHQALDYYFARKWGDALFLIVNLREKNPDKKIYKIYEERILEFQKNPPPSDWDMIFIHSHK